MFSRPFFPQDVFLLVDGHRSLKSIFLQIRLKYRHYFSCIKNVEPQDFAALCVEARLL